MAKVKPPKPKKEKPVKAKKEKPVKAKKEKTPKQPKVKKTKIKVRHDLYTLVMALTFLAVVTACIFLHFNNAFHTANM